MLCVGGREVWESSVDGVCRCGEVWGSLVVGFGVGVIGDEGWGGLRWWVKM